MILTDLSNAIEELWEKISFPKHFKQSSPNETWRIERVTRSREYQASEKRPVSRKHRVSSVTSKITRNYRVL